MSGPETSTPSSNIKSSDRVISKDMYALLQNLQLRLDNATNEKNEATASSAQWQQKCRSAETQVGDLTYQLQDMKTQLQTLLHASHEGVLWKGKCEKAEAEAKEASRELQELRRQYIALIQDSLEYRKEKVEEKDEELRVLREALSRNDNCSQADVVAFLDGINNRVEELSKEASSLCSLPAAQEGTRLTTGALDALKTIIGPKFVEFLNYQPSGDRNPLHMQLALQGIILYVICDLVQSSLADDEDEERDEGEDHQDGVNYVPSLGRLVAFVRQSEPQSSYGQWRFIAHRGVRMLQSDEEKEKSSLRTIKRAIDCCYSAGLVLLKEGCPVYDSFVKALGGPVAEIILESKNLAVMVHEGVITKNLLLYAPTHDDHFDAGSMDCTPTERPGRTVLCTIRLGMFSEGNFGTVGGKGSPADSVVLKKPHVLILESIEPMTA